MYGKLAKYPLAAAVEREYGVVILNLRWRDTTLPLAQQLTPVKEFTGTREQAIKWLEGQGVLLDPPGIH